MKSIIVDKLFDSFKDLEVAIQSARKAFERNQNPPAGVVQRIEQYDEMLMKQRELAVALCAHAQSGNWSEVSRHIRLINGLSQMIRDDAREILSYLEPRPNVVPTELMLS